MSQVKTFRVSIRGREENADNTAIVTLAATKLDVYEDCILAKAADGSVIFKCVLPCDGVLTEISE